jgi:hypothetical protein
MRPLNRLSNSKVISQSVCADVLMTVSNLRRLLLTTVSLEAGAKLAHQHAPQSIKAVGSASFSHKPTSLLP